MEKVIGIIPARYQSSRFPGKPLALINGKPMIQWVYEKTAGTAGIFDTYVATDDERIGRCVRQFGGKAVMTSPAHKSGSQRIAECAKLLNLDDGDIVLNIQGDEPLIQETMIRELLSTIQDNRIPMGTLKERITEEKDIRNPNIVKVITDVHGDALYFSRLPIPYNRDGTKGAVYYRHVGVYAYRVSFLKTYVNLPKSHLEDMEGLEQLKALEYGYKIRVKETVCSSVGVDTEEQLKQAEEIMRRRTE